MNNDFDVFYKNYHQHKYQLTRWRAFAAEHKLADGDCLVFQLIERRKFKVSFNLFPAHDFRLVFQKRKVTKFGTQIILSKPAPYPAIVDNDFRLVFQKRTVPIDSMIGTKDF